MIKTLFFGVVSVNLSFSYFYQKYLIIFYFKNLFVLHQDANIFYLVTLKLFFILY